MISLCITHCVDEDISWVEDVYGDLVIYDKGDVWKYPYPKLDAPKIKNEVDTYLRAIIELYDCLPNYSWISFLKPNCKEYCPDVTSYISVNLYNQIESDKIIFLSQNVINFNLQELVSFISPDEINFWHNIIEIMNKFGIDIKDKAYPCAVGSQYFMNVIHILSKPKEWWISLHNFAIALYEIYGDKISAIFEILWPPIFHYSIT